MNVQVLIATMHQMDYSLLEKMNIQTDAIVGNQCDRNEIEDFEWNGHRVQYLNFAERGLSKNRNNALIRATGDVCLLADDDMVYQDGYEKTVLAAFEDNLEADVLIFNIDEPTRTRRVIQTKTRVHWLNYLRYGSVRIAFRLNSIRENGIFFNQCFGSGTDRGFGEDNLFLTECLRKKLKIYAIPVCFARLTEERDSTWFRGYDEKYLKNKGLLFRAISRRWWKLLCLQDALRHRSEYLKGWHAIYRIMTANIE